VSAIDVYDRRRRELRAEPRCWLVTGAAGFIGSHLVENLLALGQRVVGLDNFATGSRENLSRVEQALGSPAAWRRFRFIEADIVDPQACGEAAAGADYVLHQAALGSVPRSIEDPRATHLVNVDGTLNVFLAAIAAGVRRVVYASSSSVYGDGASLPKREPAIGEPLSPYAASKRMGEIYANVLGRTHGLCAVGLRYFNVFGPRQDPAGPYAAVVPRWCDKLARGEPAVIFGDGETTRDFCPVLNVVQGNILAATADGALAGRVYNLALQQRISLAELYRALRSGLSERGFPCADLEPEYREFRPGDIRHSLADIGAASRDLGYTPRVSLLQGLDSVMDAWVLTL
jgi:UDP-N-acetylglucosamine/UDP-N-acetylgalactosamine 4-epimerase